MMFSMLCTNPWGSEGSLVQLGWDAPTDTGECPILGYTVPWRRVLPILEQLLAHVKHGVAVLVAWWVGELVGWLVIGES